MHVLHCVPEVSNVTVADTVKRAGFMLASMDSLVSHEKSHSHYFCFQQTKTKEKLEQAPDCSE